MRVNALCPGPVDTPLLARAVRPSDEVANRRLVHVPSGRFPRSVDEIAGAALFLASRRAVGYVNATAFMVDGGISGAYVTPL